ncbi:hypothetical protein [Alteribacter populi]|uniref:hypothetical protein n=1 Tax=Alteribacter populi TaxID=2011011 RepID=UPI000BBAADD8|nr:hypothetical protein [Alteribacter populi]
MKRKRFIALLICFTLATILLSSGYSTVNDISPLNALDTVHMYEIGTDTSFPYDSDKLFTYVFLVLTAANLLTKLILSLHQYPDWHFKRIIILLIPIYYGADYIDHPFYRIY